MLEHFNVAEQARLRKRKKEEGKKGKNKPHHRTQTQGIHITPTAL